ncbi:MAG: hypothetical protein IH927_07985 [Proteobacteria bacterium]|nr:hypothetical protein [Pseudomonadota bacterium]
MQDFFKELMRRNVTRVALVYIIVAWVTIQVVDVMFPALHVPDWAISITAALIIIGFPFALIFAWAFEMTPEGLKKEKDVDRSQSITTRTGRKLDFMIIGALAIAVAFLLFDKLILTGSEDEVAQVSTPDQAAETSTRVPEKSIAVLPFVNMSSNIENEYFSDGLSEELLNVLAKMPGLKVAGRTSSFQFKGENKDLRLIGEQLGVAHVLEGSVRQSGVKVRITAQLIDTETGFHLWSETFDRELNDIFAIQDEISASVAAALKVTLFGEGGGKVVSSRGTDNLEAYDLYLRGRYLREHISRENIQQSIAVLHEAVAIDPDYAAAWAQLSLSQARWTGAYTESLQFAQGYAIARRYAERALALDDQLAEAHIALGAGQWVYDFDLAASGATFLRALELEPSNIDALGWYGAQMSMDGQTDIALETLEKAVELDPLSMLALDTLSSALTLAGRFDESMELQRHALEIDPEVARIHGRIAYNYLLQGKLVEAEAEYEKEPVKWVRNFGKILVFGRTGEHDAWTKVLDEYIREYGKKNAYQIAEIYADAGDPDAAFEWLDIALEVRDPGLVWVKTDALLSSLYDDPRWLEFLDRVFNSD